MARIPALLFAALLCGCNYDAALDPPSDGGVVQGSGPLVFITAAGYTGDLMHAGAGVDGPSGADKLCNQAAAAAGRSGTFRAWISTQQVNAIDRITGDGPWYLTNGTLAFSNHANLAGQPRAKIEFDELGNASGSMDSAWTGTQVGGAYSSKSCNGWTDGTYNQEATYGMVSTLSGWTDASFTGCSTHNRLYCFQQ